MRIRTGIKCNIISTTFKMFSVYKLAVPLVRETEKGNECIHVYEKIIGNGKEKLRTPVFIILQNTKLNYIVASKHVLSFSV